MCPLSLHFFPHPPPAAYDFLNLFFLIESKQMFKLPKHLELHYLTDVLTRSFEQTNWCNCFSKNGSHPDSFWYFFVLFPTNITIFTTIWCEKCRSITYCKDLNPQPLACEFPPITTRPGLPINPMSWFLHTHFAILLKYHLAHNCVIFNAHNLYIFSSKTDFNFLLETLLKVSLLNLF